MSEPVEDVTVSIARAIARRGSALRWTMPLGTAANIERHPLREDVVYPAEAVSAILPGGIVSLRLQMGVRGGPAIDVTVTDADGIVAGRLTVNAVYDDYDLYDQLAAVHREALEAARADEAGRRADALADVLHSINNA